MMLLNGTLPYPKKFTKGEFMVSKAFFVRLKREFIVLMLKKSFIASTMVEWKVDWFPMVKTIVKTTIRQISIPKKIEE